MEEPLTLVSAILTAQFALAIALSTPAFVCIVKWVFKSDTEVAVPGHGTLPYVDRDGAATVDSMRSFSDRAERAGFAAAALVGCVASFALLARSVEEVRVLAPALLFGIWVCSSPSFLLSVFCLFSFPAI